MNLSMNEVDNLCRKAARGAGLSWGLAEEAGKVARYLHRHNRDGAAGLAETLDHLARGDLADFEITNNDGILTAAGGVHSPLIAGPAMLDWCFTLGGGTPLTFLNLPNPLVFAGYVGMAAQAQGRAFRLTWSGASCTFARDLWLGQGGDGHAPTDVTCYACDLPVVPAATLAARAVVRAETLVRLERYAHRTYAPETEASRLAGAGAGLNDND